MNSNQSQTDRILQQVERGEISVDEAEGLLAGASGEDRRRTWSVDDLVSLAAHGIPPEQATELLEASGRDLTVSEIAALHANGVTPELLSALREAGHAEIAVHEVVGFALNRLTPDFVRESAPLGLLSPADLLALRASGVTPSQIVELQNEGLDHLSLPELIGLAVNGADATFVQRLRAEGRLTLSGAQLIGLAAARAEQGNKSKSSR